MKTRTITGVVLAAALIAAIAIGGWFFSVVCIIAIGVALHEMIHILKENGHQVVRWPVWLATVLAIPCFLIYENELLVPIVAITTMVIVGYVLFHGEPKIEDILYSLLPFYAVSLPGMCLLAQINAPARYLQVMLLFTTFAVPLAGDTLAYFIGCAFGKHKLIPAVSPKKTVEGAAAGLFGSMLGAVAVYAITAACVEAALPPVWHYVLLGLFGGIAGQMGDLFASLVKRHCGVKDYGNIFPGHGGMMDRIDSVLFMAVLVYIYQSIMW
ncbi:MAG: phosphatidate cytidylyltransferase [Clostridia bacterium]|nr:phosphatidate cytidylyltransferase [Clostridia bacterium]